MSPRKTMLSVSSVLTVGGLAGLWWLAGPAAAQAQKQEAKIEPVAHVQPAAATALIPRKIIFGNPDRANPQISPDGTKLAYLAPVDGVLNVWVGPVDKPDAAKPVTKDRKRGIRQYQWAFTNQHILYVQDEGGDENWHVYSTDLANGETKDLTPFKGVAARIQERGPKFPDEILVAVNNRDPKLHDIYRVNVRTGQATQVVENQGFVGYMTDDDDYLAHLAMRMTPDGGMELLKADGKGGWAPFTKIASEDSLTTQPLGFDKSGQALYMVDSRGRDTAALVAVNLGTGEKKTLIEDARADIDDSLIHPTEKTVQAVGVNYDRKQWKTLDKALDADFAYLKTVADGDFDVTSRTLDDKHWIVTYVMDSGPVRFYLYDRAAKKATFLFTNRKNLEGVPLAKMHPVVIKARDGLNLVSYYTLPVGSDAKTPGKPDKPLPLVLFVHGGPWGRDQWGYNSYHQWLANRGYAVLSVNFRASTGFGKNFVNAGNKEWAGKMHNDLLDAVDWAVKQGIADPKRVAIMGGSYGGYATLVGLTFTPDVFACGVDIVGPSNIVTLLNTIPPYWAPMIEMFTTRVGDHRTEEGKKFLTERSPLTFVDKIKKPLLIGQGANDPRVKQSEADQIVKAMQEKKIPVAYVLFPDEGHGFARPENNMAFNAVTEAFLAQHIGGQFESIGDDLQGSSIQVPTGADQVPGLPQALPNKGRHE